MHYVSASVGKTVLIMYLDTAFVYGLHIKKEGGVFLIRRKILYSVLFC